MVFLQMNDRRGEEGSSHMLTIFTSTSSDDDATPQFSFNHNHIKGLQQLAWNWPFQQLSKMFNCNMFGGQSTVYTLLDPTDSKYFRISRILNHCE